MPLQIKQAAGDKCIKHVSSTKIPRWGSTLFMALQIVFLLSYTVVCCADAAATYDVKTGGFS
jgi:hypothetical protein